MIQTTRRMRLTALGASLAMLLACESALFAQADFRNTGPRNSRGGRVNLSEATALLESAVRALYQEIEPGRETSPNELIAYADLRALRLYTGALEVAGWDLEQATAEYHAATNGRYRGGRGRPGDERAEAARERYLAFRETVRTLLFRVRSTAVGVEHQVSFCDYRIARKWQTEVVPALMETIAATEPLFYEQDTYVSYHIPGQDPPRVVQTSSTGIPNNAVEVDRNRTYQPYDGRGRGQGRYLEIRAYGGAIRVKKIRYKTHEHAFGVIGTTVLRELDVDQVATPSDPLYIPCNRERFVELSELEVEWESADGRRRAYGTIDVVAERPRENDRPRSRVDDRDRDRDDDRTRGRN